MDARTFDAQQTIRVGPADQDTPITGLTFSQDSQKLFVGMWKCDNDWDMMTDYAYIGHRCR